MVTRGGVHGTPPVIASTQDTSPREERDTAEVARDPHMGNMYGAQSRMAGSAGRSPPVRVEHALDRGGMGAQERVPVPESESSFSFNPVSRYSILNGPDAQNLQRVPSPTLRPEHASHVNELRVRVAPKTEPSSPQQPQTPHEHHTPTATPAASHEGAPVPRSACSSQSYTEPDTDGIDPMTFVSSSLDAGSEVWQASPVLDAPALPTQLDGNSSTLRSPSLSPSSRSPLFPRIRSSAHAGPPSLPTTPIKRSRSGSDDEAGDVTVRARTTRLRSKKEYSPYGLAATRCNNFDLAISIKTAIELEDALFLRDSARRATLTSDVDESDVSDSEWEDDDEDDGQGRGTFHDTFDASSTAFDTLNDAFNVSQHATSASRPAQDLVEPLCAAVPQEPSAHATEVPASRLDGSVAARLPLHRQTLPRSPTGKRTRGSSRAVHLSAR
ncbi:hypothetical protein FA95DRAFT_1614137, partial [Auriscalpium vulgare]